MLVGTLPRQPECQHVAILQSPPSTCEAYLATAPMAQSSVHTLLWSTQGRKMVPGCHPQPWWLVVGPRLGAEPEVLAMESLTHRGVGTRVHPI